MKKYTFYDTHCPPELITPRLKAVNPVCLDILYKRGIRTPEAMEAFLFPSLTAALHSQTPMADADKAVTILSGAVKRRLPVAIYHDYDADGVTAAAIALDALRRLGLPVYLYCNDRVRGGFGINAAGVEEIMREHPDTKILMTVDNGVTGIEGVARAKELGLTVIVTDHHEPDAVLPAADAVVDNKRKDGPEGQDKNCCGAGVAWKLMLALYSRLGMDVSPIMNLLDIAALGTVADVVPLLGDNRVIVQEGLKLINAGKRPFFRVFSNVMDLQSVDSMTIAFRIAPMINAVSRMGHDVKPVVRTLLCEDEETLKGDIIEMSNINEERKAATARAASLAEKAVRLDGKAAIIFRDASIPEGIVGIVAGQLKETYLLPCVVLTQTKDGNWKGSCRSPEGFHLKEALDTCAEYLVAYGGHAKAAGVTVRADDFEAFQKRFEELAMAKSDNGRFFVQTPIDAVLPSSAYTEQMVRELRVLEPYGEGFPAPLFGLRASIVETRYMGNEKQHVKYMDDTGLAVIQWNAGDAARARRAPPAKFVGTPSLNSWNGNVSVQFIVS